MANISIGLAPGSKVRLFFFRRTSVLFSVLVIFATTHTGKSLGKIVTCVRDIKHEYV